MVKNNLGQLLRWSWKGIQAWNVLVASGIPLVIRAFLGKFVGSWALYLQLFLFIGIGLIILGILVLLVQNKSVAKSNDALEESKIANIYWTGHDLMWTLAELEKDDSTKYIKNGLIQFLHQASSCRIQASLPNIFEPIVAAKVKVEVLSNQEGKLPSQLKEEVKGALERAYVAIGAFIECKQPGFIARPESNKDLWLYTKSVHKT